MATFTQQLEASLKEFNPYPDEIESAIKRLSKFKRVDNGGLTTQGPCLNCGAHIEYKINYIHRRHGDKWLNKLLRTWKRPPSAKIYRCHSGIAINDIKLKIFEGYTCAKCLEEIQQWVTLTAKQESRKEAAERRAENDLMMRDRRELPIRKTMPYREYLKTDYWRRVREEKLYRAKNKCELCGAYHLILNVHHKTYEHRGDELNNLRDLIVLCADCHGKFHDKLPQVQE